MLKNSDIKTLFIGFRYEKSFRISDIIGELFDAVLHDSSSPFGTDFFPRFEEYGSLDKSLVNPDTGHFLRITTSDLIFKYALPLEQMDFDNEFKWFTKDATSFLVDKIISGYKIRNIMRVGIMFQHLLETNNIGGKVLTKLSNDNSDLKDADQFTLRFGKKDSALEGFIKKGVNDYINKISSITQGDSDKYEITFDFQYHFNPHYMNIKEWDIQTFCSKSLFTLNSFFYNIVSSLMPVKVESL